MSVYMDNYNQFHVKMSVFLYEVRLCKSGSESALS